MKDFNDLDELYSSIDEVNNDELDLEFMGVSGLFDGSGQAAGIVQGVAAKVAEADIDLLKSEGDAIDEDLIQVDSKGEIMHESVASIKTILGKTNKLLEVALSAANELTDNINSMDDTLKVLNMSHTSGDNAGTLHTLEALKRGSEKLTSICSKVSELSVHSGEISSEVAENYTYAQRTEAKLLKGVIDTCVELKLLSKEEASAIHKTKDLVGDKAVLQRIAQALRS